MEQPGQPISLRRKVVRDTILIFVGFILVVLCFVFLGVAQSYFQDGERKDCDHCVSKKNGKAFRLLAAICFMFGFTMMTIFWWHIRALRSSHEQQRGLMELQRILVNQESPLRGSLNRRSLGRRNIGWCPSILTTGTRSLFNLKRLLWGLHLLSWHSVCLHRDPGAKYIFFNSKLAKNMI